MIVEFDPGHCLGARAHPSQARYQDLLDDPQSFREWWPQTYSALDRDDLIAIGGSTLVAGKSGGWVLFTDRITPARFVPIHRAVARLLVYLEATGNPFFLHADPDNTKAARWAGLLGLEPLRTDVMPDGRKMTRMVAPA